jgi:YidC/Oxa1 family membrane protein insertase
VFYPLTEASGKSMAKMRTVQPRLKALQERHKDNKQALSQATMELYKKEKVNPLAGCLPMLIQIPFLYRFIGFCWRALRLGRRPFFFGSRTFLLETPTSFCPY